MIRSVDSGQNLFLFIFFIKLYGIIIISGEISNFSVNHHPENVSSSMNLFNDQSVFLHHENASQQQPQSQQHQSIISAADKQWHFHFDMFIILFLAFSSFCANTGLLYLGRQVKPSSTMNNSSFSNNFITITNNNNNNNSNSNMYTTINTTTSSNNINSTLSMPNNSNTSDKTTNQPCSTFNFLFNKWSNRKFSHGFNYFLTNQSSNEEVIMKHHHHHTTSGTIPTTRSYSVSSPPIMNKYPSSVSLIKLNQPNHFYPYPHHHGSTQHHHTPRSRRQRRYLRGLLGLSISNLSLSICLLSWCTCQIIIHNIDQKHDAIKAWLTLIAFINIWTIDIAQTLEIGAILWIALERTLGIHWPSEIQTLNNNTTNNNNISSTSSTKNKPTTCNTNNNNNDSTFSFIKNTLNRFKQNYCTTMHSHYHTLFAWCTPSTSLYKNRTTVTTSIKSKSSTSASSVMLINKKRSELYKRITWFIRVLLCFLPFILFVSASIYSFILIIQQIKRQKFLLLTTSSSSSSSLLNQPFLHSAQFTTTTTKTLTTTTDSHLVQQHQLDIISNWKTTYIKLISSINNHHNISYIQYVNSLVIYHYYYNVYFSNDLLSSKHTASLQHTMYAKYQTYMYYTSSIIPALIIGQFLAPLAILVTTNLLIYQK
ncbi:unnamed protein product, partial [Schistosoma turkestanicum]